MVEIHCTLKLAKRTPFTLSAVRQRSTNRLGPWCGNVFNLGRNPCVIMTNEKTLLTVIVSFKDIHTLWERTVASLYVQLQSLGLPKTLIHEELIHMGQVDFSRNTTRRVLGSMNDFVSLCKSYFQIHPHGTFEESCRQINKSPCRPLNYGMPYEHALNILSAPAMST